MKASAAELALLLKIQAQDHAMLQVIGADLDKLDQAVNALTLRKCARATVMFRELGLAAQQVTTED